MITTNLDADSLLHCVWWSKKEQKHKEFGENTFRYFLIVWVIAHENCNHSEWCRGIVLRISPRVFLIVKDISSCNECDKLHDLHELKKKLLNIQICCCKNANEKKNLPKPFFIIRLRACVFIWIILLNNFLPPEKQNKSKKVNEYTFSRKMVNELIRN